MTAALIISTWILSVVATFWLGYRFHDLTKKVEHLEEVVKTKVSRPVAPEEPKSTIIDPSDEVSEAIYAHEQMMKKMNPE